MSSEEVKKTFSKNLRNILKREEKTQADLARFMNVSTATVSDWCNGKNAPRADRLKKICSWLRVELSDLLEEKQGDDYQYYFDDETAALAQHLHDRDDLKIMFDASRNLKPEDVQVVTNLIERMTNNYAKD